MARSTAYEKLRVAHQLQRRPAVRTAYANGELSYSAVRAITSLDDPDPEVDEALVELGRSSPLARLERAVRYYQCLEDQELGRGINRDERRQINVYRGWNGLGQLRANLTNAEIDQVEALLRAFIEPEPTDEPFPSAAADGSTGAEGGGASAAADGSTASAVFGRADPDWNYFYGRKRADAFMDAVSVALAGAHNGRAVGADRYMVHLVADASMLLEGGQGRCELVDGSPVSREEMARTCCDASVVAHLVRDGTEPMALSRRVRGWTAAQRRAIRVRDGGRCRFPGCQRAITDVHHIVPWEEGGATDVDNGALLCTRHHTLVHAEYRTKGNGSGEMIFHYPGGQVLGVTRPAGALPLVA